jgi:hypothetical protein
MARTVKSTPTIRTIAPPSTCWPPDGPALSSKLRRLLKDKSLLQYGGYCTPAVARTAVRDAQTLVDAMSDYGIAEQTSERGPTIGG